MVPTWGPHFIQFYNDAYSKLIGDKHPAALGLDIRITLAEGWATLGPMSGFRSAIEKAGLELAVECPPLPEPGYVDSDMWEKIVLNLLSNAFKFTQQGCITVRQEIVDGQIELAVSDTGCGIPATELPYVFNRFHRVAGTTGRTYEGTGIGLALVQELVRLHGGTIKVESVEGQGSTFIVSIPRGLGASP